MRLAGLLSAALLAAVPVSGAHPAEATHGLTLERIVVVERHGVRAPTKSPQALSALSSQPWPEWPVAPGELTAHGALDVRIMGAWLRQDYARRGLWPSKGCPAPGQVYVWADGQDQRTRLSGQSVLEGAFPNCGLQANHGPEGESDGLFSASDKDLCPIDPKAASSALMSRTGGDLNRLGQTYDAAKAALRKVLTAPDAPACTGEDGPCFLDGANRLKTSRAGGASLEGPLAQASTVTESLYLEYAQGMSGNQMAWGRATSQAAIAGIMPLHNLETDLIRRTPYIAEHNGALAMRAVLAALGGQSALGVDWTLQDQPDKTPPDAALVFELWRGGDGQHFVRVALVYQTLRDLRESMPLTPDHPAHRVDLAIPGCADGPGDACTVQRFETLIGSRLPPECLLRPRTLGGD
jgi:4-phytase/acid phosphatase